jgi:hypothetical protein
MMLDQFGMQDYKPCKTLLLLISRKMPFLREKVYLRRVLKDNRASKDL